MSDTLCAPASAVLRVRLAAELPPATAPSQPVTIVAEAAPSLAPAKEGDAPGKGLGEFYAANKMEQFASALEELGVLEVADLAEVTDAQLDAMGMTVIQRKRLRRQVPDYSQGPSRPASPSRKGAQGVSRPASPNRGGAE